MLLHLDMWQHPREEDAMMLLHLDMLWHPIKEGAMMLLHLDMLYHNVTRVGKGKRRCNMCNGEVGCNMRNGATSRQPQRFGFIPRRMASPMRDCNVFRCSRSFARDS
mmetsp:Transcript_72208/g.172226  ORF Transcript_72208/g.172226 Transcript_72208/m.172226 type:complete len:107 (-) Transcript_72208:1437-1757(-)